MHRTKVKIVEEALDANNTIAQANRADFDRAGVRVINFMSAPGAGKTALLERVLADLPGVRVGVLEGDVQGSMDADRLASLHVPVTQLNTDPSFGGECHLDPARAAAVRAHEDRQLDLPLALARAAAQAGGNQLQLQARALAHGAARNVLEVERERGGHDLPQVAHLQEDGGHAAPARVAFDRVDDRAG